MPDLPAIRLDQAGCTPIPTGDTTPKPVTTTRRLDALIGLDKATPRNNEKFNYLRLAVT